MTQNIPQISRVLKFDGSVLYSGDTAPTPAGKGEKEYLSWAKALTQPLRF